MSEFVVKCPHCNNDVTIKSEYAGQMLECPCCQNVFQAPEAITVPAAPEAPSSSHITKSYTGNYYTDKGYHHSQRSSVNIGGIIKLIVIGSIIAVGVYLGVNKLIQKSDENLLKPDSIEVQDAYKLSTQYISQWFHSGKIFLYTPAADCNFIAAEVKHTGGNKYEGTIEFSYKSNVYKRKFVCYKNGSEFSGDVEVDYIKNPQYALEDVPLLYNDLRIKKQNTVLKNWEYKSATSKSDILYDGKTRKFYLTLQNEYTNETTTVTFYITQLGINNIQFGIE